MRERARVGDEYVRYAAEFLGRINLATVPLLAILAARGASSGWDESMPAPVRAPLRWTAVVLTSWAMLNAWWGLVGWFNR